MAYPLFVAWRLSQEKDSVKYHGNSPNMLEISAKRRDVFWCVVFTISLCFHNPRLPSCARFLILIAYYILEIPHILLTLQRTKERIWKQGFIGKKAREIEQFCQIIGNVFTEDTNFYTPGQLN